MTDYLTLLSSGPSNLSSDKRIHANDAPLSNVLLQRTMGDLILFFRVFID